MTRLRNKIIRFFYVKILKPIFFLQDPEVVHDSMLQAGRLIGKLSLCRLLTNVTLGYKNKRLAQTVMGVHFKNPVGLAAGFDKDAQILPILPNVGFGFVEIGSITAKPYVGNPKPRLIRIPEKESIRVYYGLKNTGYKAILPRVQKEARDIPVGISIAKTNCNETIERTNGIADYAETYNYAQNHAIGDYITINISCPNVFGGQPFTDAESFGLLMQELSIIPKKLPVLVKLSPDVTDQELYTLVNTGMKYNVDGFICTNLSKKDNGRGGLSGKVVESDATEMIRKIYAYTNGNTVIIGLGGIFTAEDAYIKIKAGATLVQLITGMIYGGPQTISEINEGLVRLLIRDGFTHLSEAIGVDHR